MSGLSNSISSMQRQAEENQRAQQAHKQSQQQISAMQAANPDRHFINPNLVNADRHAGANNTLAQLHRAQWEDWTSRFKPRLEQLAGYAQTGELTHQAVGLADSAMQDSFAQVRQNQQMQNQGLGIQQSAAQQQASERTLGLAEASSRAAARNQARVAGQDRDMQILAGSGGIQQGLQG